MCSKSPRVSYPTAFRLFKYDMTSEGFPGVVKKKFTCNAGDARDVDSIPESGRSLGGVHGNSLQYSCLENPMDRGAWWATVHVVAKSQTRLK